MMCHKRLNLGSAAGSRGSESDKSDKRSVSPRPAHSLKLRETRTEIRAKQRFSAVTWSPVGFLTGRATAALHRINRSSFSTVGWSCDLRGVSVALQSCSPVNQQTH